MGAGLNMGDPQFPIGVNSQAFKDIDTFEEKDQAIRGARLESREIENSTFSFFESVTVHEEARYLSAYLTGAYGLSSGDAAYQYAYNRKDTERSIFVVISNVRSGEDLDATNLTWKKKPASESVADAERRRQFLDDFGSHYITSVSYGYRVAIRGATRDIKESESAAFKASFKAVFSSFSAAGNVSAGNKKTLTKNTVDLRAEVLGTLNPEQSFVLTSYDEIIEFLRQIKSGQITISRVPVMVNARSYWHTLTPYRKTRAALAQVLGVVATAPWGVPSGTVIAWSPRPDQQWVDAQTKETKIAVPEGWALCDGSDSSVPDLRSRFVMGARDVGEINQPGGSATHAHKGKTGGGAGNQHEFRDADSYTNVAATGHTHTIAADSSLPPYVALVYIIKR